MTDEGTAARRTALAVLARIEDDGAYANLALGPAMEASGLEPRDRALVTDLVYGTVRMRRGLDHLIDGFVDDSPPAPARRALRLGTYQIVHRRDIPAYAAVSATVGAAPKRFRGLINAVLRKVADAPVRYPDPATELSYPDWIVDRLTADLGAERAEAALRSMNEPATVHVRDDGYVQDLASQWVAAAVGAGPGECVLDLCAAPGGKATALAGTGAFVAAMDLHPARAALVTANARRTGAGDASGPAVVVGDAVRAPFRPGCAERVLLDAPCSGLGVLRRRADARWRIEEAAVDRLAALQRDMVDAAVALLRPGGVLVYSVCTLTAAETLGIDEHVRDAHPDLVALESPGDPWEPWGRGTILLPQTQGTDGMALMRYRRDS